MSKANVLTVILGVVLVAILAAGYFMFAKPSDVDPSEDTVKSEPVKSEPVKNNSINGEVDYSNLPADIEALEGVSRVQKEHLLSVRELKKFIQAHPEGGPEVTSAFTRLNKEYYRFPSQVHFDEIFYGEPDMFSHLVADPDAKPSQVDVSFLNFWKYASENYGYTAESEINIADEMINLQPEIYRILGEYCASIEYGMNETCDPPVEQLLTPAQVEAFNQLVVDLRTHLDNADALIPDLVETKEWFELGNIYLERTRVLHKMRLFGLSTPAEIVASAMKAVEYTEKGGKVERRIDAQIVYALIIAELLSGTDGYEDTIASLLGAIYEPDGKLKSRVGWYSRYIAQTYEQVVSGEHTQGNHMTILGMTKLALIDPGYKQFLEINAGVDFDSPTMKAYIEEAKAVTRKP